MNTPEFPCRTREISGISYHVVYYNKDGRRSLSTSFSSEAKADDNIAHMTTNCPGLTATKTPNSWTETVCIECGAEAWMPNPVTNQL